MFGQSALAGSCFLLAALVPVEASAQNSLEISMDKYEVDASFRYRVRLEANKVGVSTCRLVVNGYSWACSLDPEEETWVPEQAFLDAHSALAFEQLALVLQDDWTLSWDVGLPTETSAPICFRAPEESDWPPVPRITEPEDGGRALGDTTINWTYFPVSCDPVLDDEHVEINGVPQDGGCDVQGSLPCPTGSWDPVEDPFCETPLPFGKWEAVVCIDRSELFVDPQTGWIRDLDGTACPLPTGDPWFLENDADDAWLNLGSESTSTFTVVAVPSMPGGWAAYGALAGVLLALARGRLGKPALRSRPARGGSRSSR